MLRVKLGHLDRWNRMRRERARSYREHLTDAVRMLDVRDAESCVYHLFPVRLDDRDAAQRRLGAAGVETGVHYSPALHEQTALRDTARVRCELPRATAWARDELSLPIYPGLTETHIERVLRLLMDR